VLWGAHVEGVRQVREGSEGVGGARVGAGGAADRVRDDTWESPVKGGQVVVRVRSEGVQCGGEVGKDGAGREGGKGVGARQMYAHCCVGADGIHSSMRRCVRSLSEVGIVYVELSEISIHAAVCMVVNEVRI